jgi:hypothetical protein
MWMGPGRGAAGAESESVLARARAHARTTRGQGVAHPVVDEAGWGLAVDGDVRSSGSVPITRRASRARSRTIGFGIRMERVRSRLSVEHSAEPRPE